MRITTEGLHLPLSSLKQRISGIFVIIMREIMFQAISLRHTHCLPLSLPVLYQLLYVSKSLLTSQIIVILGLFAVNNYFIFDTKLFCCVISLKADTESQRFAESVRTFFCHHELPRLLPCHPGRTCLKTGDNSHVISADLYHHHFGLEKKNMRRSNNIFGEQVFLE